jgi:cell division protein FtsB
MGQNRKNQTGAVRFVGALKAILLCMLIGGSAVGFVLQKNKLLDLSKQIAQREAYLEKLRWENKIRANQLAELQSPLKIEQRVAEQKLFLLPPQPSQTIWLAEPTAAKPLVETPAPGLAAVRNP